MREIKKVNLKKKKLDELAKTMNVINKEEQRTYFGGGLGIFEIKCFMKYLSCSGDMELSSVEFQGIADAANNANTVHSSWVYKNGQWYNLVVKDFYGNDNYDLAIGHATMIYDTCGNAVGFMDTYDFNPGDRGLFKEYLGSLAQGLGCSYNIRYGITF